MDRLEAPAAGDAGADLSPPMCSRADSPPPASRDRSSWPVRVLRLGTEPGPNLSRSTTAEQRLDMMWPLALEAWAVSGCFTPPYARKDAPVRRIVLRAASTS